MGNWPIGRKHMPDEKTIDLQLANTIEWALREKKNQRELGATHEEAEENFEKTIRAAWPKMRDEPWHYLCDRCDDTGFIRRVCEPGNRCEGWSTYKSSATMPDGKYKRRLCTLPHAGNYTHDYVSFCSCPKGEMMRPKQKQASDFTEAAKTPKRKPTRMWGSE